MLGQYEKAISISNMIEIVFFLILRRS
ncbi:hypothetical protein [Staphylococcus aureus]|nr:hypothetical protein [Staphylococcus aureus]MCQ1428321.1 hypothetical protein [Staphylococcus aureus]URH54522.1 hypothetical protein M8789_12260 [Staphylococcus aureus]UUR09780.1 hypothetical protein SAA6159_03720 [Staphylococcus aureus subsp. aureus JKD6159]UVJ09380.1 hypothetical protein NW971_12475 [Staphylococcus aureus]UXS84656.1 hypothetical protein MUA62_12125 [Staphylococcus aureus]